MGREHAADKPSGPAAIADAALIFCTQETGASKIHFCKCLIFLQATKSVASPFGTPRYVMVSDRSVATIVSNHTNAALRVTY